MNIRVKVSQGAIAKVIAKLGHLRKSVESKVADVVAEEVVDLVAEGFAKETDPYGNKWAPRKKKENRALLVKTGNLRRGWHTVKKTGEAQRTIAPNKDYAAHHQYGTGGRKAASTRHVVMPVVDSRRSKGKLGQFMSRSAAKKLRRKKGAIAVRAFSINFKVGGGKIPARPMIPDSRGMPAKWTKATNDAARDAVLGLLK